MPKIDIDIKELHNMKKYPKEISYKGNLELLNRPKVSIVGTRRPISYTKQYTTQIVKALINRGVVIVSGGAMGVDAIAHQSALAQNTISVYATGIDIKYPAVNRNLLQDIEDNGLSLSQFKDDFRATSWSFVLRNELVVALGDILIVTEADANSGSLRSVEYAIEMGKKIFVLPHRIGDSIGTNELIAKGLAKAILDIEDFASRYGVSVDNNSIPKDEFFYFCQTFPTYEEAMEKFGDRLYEAEFEEIIYIENGVVYLNG